MRCKWCGRIFTPVQSSQKFCCKTCRNEYYNKKYRDKRAEESAKRKTRCAYCGEVFTKESGNQAYCCEECKDNMLKERKVRYDDDDLRRFFQHSTISTDVSIDPYERLAISIAFETVKDYRMYAKILRKAPGDRLTKAHLMMLKDDMISNYFRSISLLDVDLVLPKLIKENGV